VKKLIAMLIVAGVLVSGVVGCGGAASTKKEEPKPKADDTTKPKTGS
jgi:hypothetical protein